MSHTNRRKFLETMATPSFLSLQTGRYIGAEAAGSNCADRRQEMLAKLELVMGPFPKQKRKPPLDIKTLDNLDLPTHSRLSITYVSEEGDRVPAYILKPKKLEGRAPAMLCLHQKWLEHKPAT